MAHRPKLLFLDIETSLLTAYTFGIRDQHIQHSAIANDRDGRLIHMVGLKWKGKRPEVLTEWDHGFEGMMAKTREAIIEADAVVTYNGARFDIPKIRGACVLAGLDPPPQPTQIDLFKTARGLGFVSSKLDYVADRLGLGSKIKHDGFSMWVDVFNGCPKARAKMARYCAGDVNLTEKVYDKLRPYINDHPHLAEVKRDQCGACGSSRLVSQGTRRTKAFVYQRLQCQCCGSWSQGRREAA
jgi:DNA polymerase elongation subunit (family B)